MESLLGTVGTFLVSHGGTVGAVGAVLALDTLVGLSREIRLT